MKYLPALKSRCGIGAMVLLLACGSSLGDAVVTPLEHPHQYIQSQDPAAPALTRPGNDIFSAIQEALHKLEADPATDWKKVNLEALRQHLLDMRHITEDVEIIAQKSLDKGVEITVRATTPVAVPGLDRAFNAHPKILKSETGWDMTATKDKDKYKLRIITNDSTEVDKLRALGYIGIMAMGNHHPLHHWMLAKGQMPH